MSTNLSQAQAAQQGNRTTDGKYTFGTHAEPDAVSLCSADYRAQPQVSINSVDELTVHGQSYYYNRHSPNTWAEAKKSLAASKVSDVARYVDLGFLGGQRPDFKELEVHGPADGSPLIINTHGAHNLQVKSGHVFIEAHRGYGGSVTVGPEAKVDVYVGPDQKFTAENSGGQLSVVLDSKAKCFISGHDQGETKVYGETERSTVMGKTDFMTENSSMFREPYDWSEPSVVPAQTNQYPTTATLIEQLAEVAERYPDARLLIDTGDDHLVISGLDAEPDADGDIRFRLASYTSGQDVAGDNLQPK